ncbi:MAG: choice-of-anchor J domain-containing protein [Chthonomonadaceae bacterium]|nr:choice-of-anchor J domain-containing protein [Chthonomonadaceae bacterium]
MKHVLCIAIGVVLSSSAMAFYEGFDDITTLAGGGWSMQNLSDLPTNNWFQGNPTAFVAFSGADDSYIGANYQFTSGTTGSETISGWLITPEMAMSNGDTFSFYTRTPDGSLWADRLQVRLGSGSSTNAGSVAEDVGNFTTLLLDINPNEVAGAANYPQTWTEYEVTMSGLSGGFSGRLAFRYYIHNAGPNGNNSNYIGIDEFNYNPVPEPATMSVLGLGALALIRRRARR